MDTTILDRIATNLHERANRVEDEPGDNFKRIENAIVAYTLRQVSGVIGGVALDAAKSQPKARTWTAEDYLTHPEDGLLDTVVGYFARQDVGLVADRRVDGPMPWGYPDEVVTMTHWIGLRLHREGATKWGHILPPLPLRSHTDCPSVQVWERYAIDAVVRAAYPFR
jgi:hypothetical protein